MYQNFVSFKQNKKKEQRKKTEKKKVQYKLFLSSCRQWCMCSCDACVHVLYSDACAYETVTVIGIFLYCAHNFIQQFLIKQLSLYG